MSETIFLCYNKYTYSRSTSAFFDVSPFFFHRSSQFSLSQRFFDSTCSSIIIETRRDLHCEIMALVCCPFSLFFPPPCLLLLKRTSFLNMCSLFIIHPRLLALPPSPPRAHILPLHTPYTSPSAALRGPLRPYTLPTPTDKTCIPFTRPVAFL
jgi:hypothetical protein